MQKGRQLHKIVIAAGGTGGHLFPAQALALDLIQREPELEAVFMSPGLKNNPYFQKGHFPYREIASATPYKKDPIKLLKAFWHLIKGTLQSLHHLGKIKPQVVIGFGSFHSFPILLAAKLRRVPIILFESNAVPGKVNRLCSRWAKFTAIHFKRAAKYLKGKTICVRMPLLKKNHGITPEKAREYYQLDKDKLTFLIFGGSQGAQAINRFFCASLEKLLAKNFNFQVVHIVGNPERAEKLREVYSKYNIPASVKPFEDKMDFAWSAADLSISRAGAATLAEQIEFTIPGILIPYPHATENHQGKNASFVAEEIKGGVKLPEGELSSDRLVSIIEDLLESQREKLNSMKKSLQDFKEAENKEDFCSVIFDFVNK
ncbi:undecaprenyldiphospho-muramoylpentapeptide beta-N-acetylglucosaminyltransferase [Simkania negevensis]|uniref:UDP-N-acetylglucosamine--N-acetylmuramyl-(pentapeptide) pyrophosphoryl-undecaprenol N-acetylglucosamine transferase n=1 Tax=Simkania negevensis (strain ATCC VR-1471 / DSM 27360 / Z) TaxID=331113 RepID=F8L9R0_SIMNZ|nr:undecaprenyldiphospho-muramoylpentapeptide beta-N-acetylglucosaminyltransferase [Simkania negevensis]MCB1073974.1 undecaprenyldiphospho-muramoylpentapeptide beta-N-acetylglucosaminyltransferase [Simkania sp.]CCB89602.1 UDP-N-acetylglucosamine--N-acetylmuramyl-(pentapeptide)pyrophosphoryl-undecaprenolN-acetylglucosamine transferase [Simkania negevensis Z]